MTAGEMAAAKAQLDKFLKHINSPEVKGKLKYILEDKDAHFTSNWVVIAQIIEAIVGEKG
ncbi:hypothetical protein LCGC14_3152390, partial [marine sediment metagenome]